jgi:hypothetical protein
LEARSASRSRVCPTSRGRTEVQIPRDEKRARDVPPHWGALGRGAGRAPGGARQCTPLGCWSEAQGTSQALKLLKISFHISILFISLISCTNGDRAGLSSARFGISTNWCQHELVSARTGVSTTRCQQELVSARLGVSTTRCQHELVSARPGVARLNKIGPEPLAGACFSIWKTWMFTACYSGDD